LKKEHLNDSYKLADISFILHDETGGVGLSKRATPSPTTEDNAIAENLLTCMWCLIKFQEAAWLTLEKETSKIN